LVTVYGELKRIRKEAVVAYLITLFRRIFKHNKRNYEMYA
jgi:hypothetical protein